MSLREIQQILEAIGVKPSKVLGQNFLFDRNLANSIVQALGGGDDPVVEVGPGLGALTELLAKTRRRVLAIEWDRKLAGHLDSKFANEERVVVANADAAEYDTRDLYLHGTRYLIGNLPYKASAPILFRFLAPTSPIMEVVTMLQQEMAERIAARVGQDGYGSAAVVLQRRWNIELMRNVAPTVFYPRPRVDSSVLRFRLKPADELVPCPDYEFERLVRLGFSQRRKQLRNLMATETDRWPQLCEQCEIDEKCRAEDLDVGSWVKLVNLLTGTGTQVAQSPDSEMFDVVDAHDQPIGRASRSEVHAKRLLHRAVHIIIENAAGEIFLQKRSAWKDVCPGKWDSSAAGHVDAGEDYATAAAREVVEELGVGVVLEAIGKINACEQTGWEFVEVFHGVHDGPFRLPPAEIEAGEFFSRSFLQSWLQLHPDDFAPGFLASYSVLLAAGK